jgi:CubicO group peptidase (beta-lactamase class C family)
MPASELLPYFAVLRVTTFPMRLLTQFLVFLAIAAPAFAGQTRVSIVDGRWQLNGAVTYPGTKAEGLLMNVRMVNAVFEDRNRPTFDADANTSEFIAQIPDYVAHGARAFTVCLQGGMPGYEGAINSAYEADGSLRPAYLARVQRVIEACDRAGAAVILGCIYQRQDQLLRDEDAVRAAITNTARWIARREYTNVLLEVANEYMHRGFDHKILKSHEGIAALVKLAKQSAPGLLVSASESGGRGGFVGGFLEHVAPACDFLLIHLNVTPLNGVAARLSSLPKLGKPVVCNEDAKYARDGAKVAEICVQHGVSWGFMNDKVNQDFPFTFEGSADDRIVYRKLRELTSNAPESADQRAQREAEAYFPPSESKGGWRKLESADDIRRLGGMDPEKLAALREWLLGSDKRDFAATVIRRGYIVLEVERGNSARTDARRVASVSKAVCATVLAIASEQSQHGGTPRKMTFDDPAFQFIPWAQPLSDPRKAKITVRQLFNHTSGINPEATGAPNDGTWEYVLGQSGDERTAKLAFDPGAGCGYTTHGPTHASLVCETVTGMPYDQFAIKALFEPIGCEHWWFQYYKSEKHGQHPSHGMGMPARDLARIAYCMLRRGEWNERQVIPRWFVDETAQPTAPGLWGVKELRTGRDALSFSHAWEKPTATTTTPEPMSELIPAGARFKRGSGGQIIAFIPSLDLVVTRQTGGSGQWEYEQYLARACQAVLR